MPAFLTPGAVFLARGALSLALPCALIALGAALLGPAAVVARHAYGQLHKRRRAAALGARLAPRLPGGIGNVDRLMQMMRSMEGDMCGQCQMDWVEECGNTFNVNVLWDDMIFTTEPDHIKSILATDFNNFEKGTHPAQFTVYRARTDHTQGEKFHSGMESLLGTGVFNSDGDMWKFHRSMTRPFFTRDRITEFDNFDRHADTMLAALRTRLRTGAAVDLQDALHRFTLDAASEFLLGTDVRSLDGALPYPSTSYSTSAPASARAARAAARGGVDGYGGARSGADSFARAFADAQYFSAQRNVRGWSWPLAEITHDYTRAPMAVVSAFLDPLLAAAVAKHRATPTSSAEKPHSQEKEIGEDETLLDHLVKRTTDEKVLKDEILNILIAGRDTTAATLAFAAYLLALHPDAMGRLRAEVLAHVGPSARPTYEVVSGMKYMRAFINGALFSSAPARFGPFDVRESVHETTLSAADPTQKPIYIPANTKVIYSAMLLHRRTDLWGPDALEFDPDRFLDARVRRYLTPKPYIFVPFNAGPRICLGQQFAYNEMSFVLVRLLQAFSSISLAADAQPADSVPPPDWARAKGRKAVERFWPQSHLTMYAKVLLMSDGVDKAGLSKLLNDLGFDTQPSSIMTRSEVLAALDALPSDSEGSDSEGDGHEVVAGGESGDDSQELTMNVMLEEELTAATFKWSGDVSFEKKDYREAILMYSHALTIADPDEKELQRTILANRAQSYIFHGDIHTALQDVDRALSPEFSASNSTDNITIKCHARKAKLLCAFARYEEALKHYKIARDPRNAEVDGDKLLRKEIEEGLAAPKGSKRRRKDVLLRAVDSRGLIVPEAARANFPFPPAETLQKLGPDFEPDADCLQFVTKHRRNPNDTPITFPMFFTAPYFKARPNQGSKPFRTRGQVLESITVGEFLQNLFSSHLIMFPDQAFVRKAMPSAVKHEHPDDRLIIMPTHRGRLLVIEPTATFKDVFSRAKWPCEGPFPFEDLRKAARARPHEVDGIELMQGWYLEVIVITKDRLPDLVPLMSQGFDTAGLSKLLDGLGFDTQFHPNSNKTISDVLNDLANDPEVSDIKVNRHEVGTGGGDPEEDELTATMFKGHGDEAFKAKKYREAIAAYSHALTIATRDEKELKRTILANRAQSYIFYGDIHSALQDVNRALSPEFSSSNLSKKITIKCHVRRAKLLCAFARYEEALEDCKIAQDLRNAEVDEDKSLKKDIEEGLAAPKGSKRWRKDELMRAVDSRGMILQQAARPNFPFPPAQTLQALGPDFNQNAECLQFVKKHGQNPNDTPIAFPIFITAPYFQARPNQGSKPFRTRGQAFESMAIGELLQNLFSSHLIMLPDQAFVRKAMPSAVKHEHPEDRLIIMPTHRGRLLIIEPTATFKDVFAGAKWPRQGPLPFEDLRKVARAGAHEVDGIELVQGWHLDVVVITKDRLQDFVTLMENGPRAPPP
ncbi:hypothetical protein HWV62_24590 [Athelia sp. TMB]|nr:hypothetical protein HWV62_24590 [Athelia sp. TMB]